MKQQLQEKDDAFSDLLSKRKEENLIMLNNVLGSGFWYLEYDEEGNRERFFISEDLAHMMGHSKTKQEDIENEFLGRVHPEDREETTSVFIQAVTGQSALDVRFRYLMQNGKYNWFSARGSGAKYPNGQLRFFLGTISNVAEEYHARQALEEAYEAARKASVAKTEFLASVSHDIRTPLNGIIGMSAIASANFKDQNKVKHCLKEIQTSSNHLLELVNKILDMNQIESGEVDLETKEFSMADFLDDFITLCKPLVASRSHTLYVRSHELVHERVIGDPGRLSQCLMNFITNAVKYTPEGGDIRFTIQEIPSDSTSTAGFEFIFEDNGVGIDEAFIPTLFDPFARPADLEARSSQGICLGLPITHSLIRLMGGDVHVESKLHEGSKFQADVFLRLPKEEKKSEPIPQSIYLGGKRVLIINADHIENRDHQLIFRQAGMDTIGVSSMTEALQLLCEDGCCQDHSSIGFIHPHSSLFRIEYQNRTSHKDDEYHTNGTCGYDACVQDSHDHYVHNHQNSGHHCHVHLYVDIRNFRDLHHPSAGLNSMTSTDYSCTAPMQTSDWDLVFMDWNLPEASGVEAIRKIRHCLDPSIPLLVSTYDWVDQERVAKESGCTELIGKPVFQSRLIKVLKDLFDTPTSEQEDESESSGVLDEFMEADFRGKKVLLAEDNEINAYITMEILEMTGLDVDHVWNGNEAVLVLETAEENQYGLVLMDIQMPGMNGYEATETIRRSKHSWLQELPIVALSANSFEEDKRHSLASGMNGHLGKPIEFDELYKTLHLYLGQEISA